MSQRIWQAVVGILAVAGIALAVDQIFHLELAPTRFELSYLYALLGLFGAPVFLLLPARKGTSRTRIPWYDVVLFLVFLASTLYLAARGLDVVRETWNLAPPRHALVIALAIWVLLIEAVRRVAEWPFTVIAALVSAYPAFAPYLPGIFEGPTTYSLVSIASFHALSTQSIMGIPMQVVGSQVIGYILFGLVLQHTGGGQFFLDLAFSLFGFVRGGAAKVAVIASAAFGSLSGSVISNVITSGAVTIPAMKRSGYPAHYAGAVEACASTGGTLMPPVMGAAAFVMAQVLQVSYYEVVVAAAVPSILYYLSLFVQVDAYAARTGMKGLNRSELPGFGQTLKSGWFYLLAVVVLIYYLFVLRQVSTAPFYASLALVIVSVLARDSRLTRESLGTLVLSVARALTELTILLAAVGFIMGSFFLTGLGGSFAHEVATLAGGSVPLLLVLGAVASFILGMGMTVAAAYVFLAITVAPALVAGGINTMAAHLFVLYWASLSYITPPVALAAFAAAPIAGVSGLKIGLYSIRLGTVKYILPFAFAYSASLLLQEGSVGTIIFNIATAAVGVVMLGGALEGYVALVGRIRWPWAVPFFLSGLMLMYPGWTVSLSGLALAAGLIAIGRFVHRRARHPIASPVGVGEGTKSEVYEA